MAEGPELSTVSREFTAGTTLLVCTLWMLRATTSWNRPRGLSTSQWDGRASGAPSSFTCKGRGRRARCGSLSEPTGPSFLDGAGLPFAFLEGTGTVNTINEACIKINGLRLLNIQPSLAALEPSGLCLGVESSRRVDDYRIQSHSR